MQFSLFRRFLVFVKETNRARLRRRRAPARLAYQHWIQENDAPTLARRAIWKAELASLCDRPLISLLMPVYNPNADWLNAAVQSVVDQIYPDWELCIADDCSTAPEVRAQLEQLVARDSRIKVTFRDTNGHISECSNSALALCRGTHVALIDQDDLIPPQALLKVAQVIVQQPDAGIIYSDEDKVGPDGLRESPSRKSNWHPSMLDKENLISHLGVYRTELIKSIGGFRKGFEGAQDHDLALRCTELLDARHILHIPEILYHWRVHPESTANSVDAKPYALVARELCLKEHATRMRASGKRTDETS